jgi:CRP/FNR family nitrogen fixation transcriptional regulator
MSGGQISMNVQHARSTNVYDLRQAVQAPSSLAHEDASDLFQGLGARMSFDRDEEIFGEGEPADFVYRVISGAVRTYRVLSDGRRQIGDFHLAGDLFGLEAGREHLFSAEAIGKCEILVCRRSALFGLAARSPDLGQCLWAQTARELERAQAHLMLLGRKSACERVASFLGALADRRPGAREVTLHMSRQDIADYLGLTIETVSRTFTQLQADGVIALNGCRQVRIVSRGALERLTQ